MELKGTVKMTIITNGEDAEKIMNLITDLQKQGHITCIGNLEINYSFV